MKLFYSRDMTFIHEAFEVALQMGKVAKIPRLVRRMGASSSLPPFASSFDD